MVVGKLPAPDQSFTRAVPETPFSRLSRTVMFLSRVVCAPVVKA